ncbi:MAG: hypothetical protein LBV04_09540 [Deferribacteraceae bacterium]|nr:hypothetical protein [Deferribacteraceae bacterium]
MKKLMPTCLILLLALLTLDATELQAVEVTVIPDEITIVSAVLQNWETTDLCIFETEAGEKLELLCHPEFKDSWLTNGPWVSLRYITETDSGNRLMLGYEADFQSWYVMDSKEGYCQFYDPVDGSIRLGFICDAKTQKDMEANTDKLVNIHFSYMLNDARDDIAGRKMLKYSFEELDDPHGEDFVSVQAIYDNMEIDETVNGQPQGVCTFFIIDDGPKEFLCEPQQIYSASDIIEEQLLIEYSEDGNGNFVLQSVRKDTKPTGSPD